jgi:Arc/MetJ family transcription regulator
MAKTLIDVDEEQLAAALKVLKTATKKDTVNAALRQVTTLAARRRDRPGPVRGLRACQSGPVAVRDRRVCDRAH